MTSKPRIVPQAISLFCVLILLAMLLGGNGCDSDTVNSPGVTKTPMPSPTAVTFDCTRMGDVPIRDKLYELLKEQYGTEFWKFNIVVTNKDIQIQGWSPHYTEIKQLVAAAATNCTMGTNPNFYETRAHLANANLAPTHNCTGNLVACGDVCVNSGHCAATALHADSKVATNSNTVTNMNTNINKTMKGTATP